jgi:hypothetical protein
MWLFSPSRDVSGSSPNVSRSYRRSSGDITILYELSIMDHGIFPSLRILAVAILTREAESIEQEYCAHYAL